MAEKLLTTKQIAQYLNIDLFTVYRLVARKKLPAFKVGSQWRFKRALIETWLMTRSNMRRRGFH